MSEVGVCSCSLQARLHQVEKARSREMTAHGEHVQQLECALESRRTNEAEIRLAVAKLRTENCRLEAELNVATAKIRQLLEQLDAMRTESTNLLEEKRQLNIQLTEYRNQFESALREKELLLAKNKELCLKANTQTAETEKLSTALVINQQEIEASAARSQLLIDDLASNRKQQNVMQGSLLVMRNRALYWKRKRNTRKITQGVFLAWKSVLVEARLKSVAKLTQCNEHNRGRLQLVEQEVLKRCSQAKEDLQSFRQACAVERNQIQSLRDEIYQVKMPKLLDLLGQEMLKIQKSHIDQLARHRTFNAWKEFYLRAVVGQATHAAMIFSSDQPQVSAANILSPSDEIGSQPWAMPGAIHVRPTSVAIQPLQLGNLRSSITPVDTMWRKWRRVDAGMTSKDKGQKLRLSNSSS